MPVQRSPVTGEVGHGPEWVRLNAAPDSGIPIHALFVPTSELHGLDLVALGFVRMADLREQTRQSGQRQPFPQSNAIGLNLSSRHDTDLILADTETTIAGAAFSDPSADEWWNAIHERGQVLLMVGDQSPVNAPKMGPWLDTLTVAAIPLAVYGWTEGVGTARPDQR